MDAARVVAVLAAPAEDEPAVEDSGDHPEMSTIVDILPSAEAQVRPLAGLEPHQQRSVWQAAVAASGGEVPTGRSVAAAKRQQVGESARPYAPIWEIQNCVREGLRKFTPRQIRTSASERMGVPWTDSAQALDGAGLRYRQNDLVQALNNSASHLEMANRKVNATESERRLTPDERVEQLRMYVQQFETVLAGMKRWGDLTGRHAVTGEAERGLRKLLEITQRELAALEGEDAD